MPRNTKATSSVTRATLCNDIKDALPTVSDKDISKLVDSVIHVMRDTLVEGEEIKISGFGKFVVKEKRARKGRNPQTGENLTIAARRVVTWKASSNFKTQLNENLIQDHD